MSPRPKKQKGGTNMWCPVCKEITVCAAIPLIYLGEERQQRLHRSKHPDLNWFRRARECQDCGHRFLTSEAREDFLDELCELRNALAAIKANAESYLAESDKASESLKKLSESLGVLRALKIYKEEKSS